MRKATTETALKMLQLVDIGTYQGKLTWLMIAFLYQTRARFSEVSSLTVGDVYHHGRAKKSVTLGAGPLRRIQILDNKTRQLIETLVLLQLQKKHQSNPESPLFRLPSTGKAWAPEEMSAIFWLYQEAAETEDKAFR